MPISSGLQRVGWFQNTLGCGFCYECAYGKIMILTMKELRNSSEAVVVHHIDFMLSWTPMVYNVTCEMRTAVIACRSILRTSPAVRVTDDTASRHDMTWHNNSFYSTFSWFYCRMAVNGPFTLCFEHKALFRQILINVVWTPCQNILLAKLHHLAKVVL